MVFAVRTKMEIISLIGDPDIPEVVQRAIIGCTVNPAFSKERIMSIDPDLGNKLKDGTFLIHMSDIFSVLVLNKLREASKVFYETMEHANDLAIIKPGSYALRNCQYSQ